MQGKVGVLTAVRDDDFFLNKWVDYYGRFFGKEALYIINHGNQQSVREIVDGSNLFRVPDIASKVFNPQRWRTQNGIMTALRQWYEHVIVCDVDEFVVVDPQSGHDLGSFLTQAKDGRILTAFGMEVAHLVDRGRGKLSKSSLGSRRHAQINSWYSKPCIVGSSTKLSRRGHYAT